MSLPVAMHDSYATPRTESGSSGVTWGAVVAGAFVAAALSLILLALGAGAGLSSLSPWSNAGVSPTTVGFGALLWLAITELIAAGMGGYVAGRLRTKWVNVHTHEVYFRDTAHGFLAWCVALVGTAAFLGSAASTMVGTQHGAQVAPQTEQVLTTANRYYIDSLFRAGQSATVADAGAREEIGAVFAHALKERALTDQDKNYVAEVVAARTGLSRPAAEARVGEVFAQDQQAADAVRKAVAHSLYWLFVALLLGAFTASFCATIGGRQRDHLHALQEKI